MELNNFNDGISVLPNSPDVFMLKERKNETKQQISFDTNDNCVLDVEKIQNHWFKDKHPMLCDFIVFYYKNKKLYCVLIEMKSKKDQKSHAIKQLQGGEKLARYIADIWNTDIHEFKGGIFYERGKVRNRSIINDKLSYLYKDNAIKIDYQFGQNMQSIIS